MLGLVVGTISAVAAVVSILAAATAPLWQAQHVGKHRARRVSVTHMPE